MFVQCGVAVFIVLKLTHKQENIVAFLLMVDISLTDFYFSVGCALTLPVKQVVR